MSISEKKQDYAFLQGEIVPLDQAQVNIQTHALQYGTGCFTGMRGYWNEEEEQIYIFRLEEHFLRLQNSSKILMMNFSYCFEDFRDIVLELVKKNAYRQGIYIRPLLYKSDLSLSPRLHDVKDDLAIYIIPLADYMDTQKGLKCAVSSWVRFSDHMIPSRAKVTGSYINSALARSEAVLGGYDEAILLDAEGKLSEGSAENLFLLRDGILFTTPVTSSILEGITRKTIFHLAQNELHLDVSERELHRSELYISDEIFFCGTGIQVAWIREIDHRIIGSGNIGPITQKLQSLYFDLVQGKNPKYKMWLTPVYSS